jgi:hypothetical protein
MHCAVWDLPQAGILANKLLKKRLLPHRYYKCTNTPGLWKHSTRPIAFTPVVDNYLGWEFQFLVPISGTPIGGGIPIAFTIPKIPVGFFFEIPISGEPEIGIPIRNFQNYGNFLHRDSVHLFVANLY